MKNIMLILRSASFTWRKLCFLKYIVIALGIKMNVNKVKTIQDWYTPKFMTKVRSFHGLAIFYK